MTAWLKLARNILAARFGNRWSTQWAQAGFINNTTSVPVRAEERIGLALSLAGFFTANPSYEVASMNVTAAQANTRYAAANSDQQAYITAGASLQTLGNADTEAFDTLTATDAGAHQDPRRDAGG